MRVPETLTAPLPEILAAFRNGRLSDPMFGIWYVTAVLGVAYVASAALGSEAAWARLSISRIPVRHPVSEKRNVLAVAVLPSALGSVKGAPMHS